MPQPRTPAPTDTEWENHRRWAIPPIGTRRQLWVQREAQAIFTERTGRADPWPDLEDYAAANAAIPQDLPIGLDLPPSPHTAQANLYQRRTR